MRKFDILDDFAHRVGNLEFELESICEHTESMGGQIRGRDLNTQLFMSFGNNLIII